MLLLIGRRVSGLENRRTLAAFAKSGLASLAMGAALIGWQTALPDAGALILGGGGVVLGRDFTHETRIKTRGYS